MFSEQRIRAFLFYLCLAVFFAGLPSILSFALGYKFDPSTFKFTKTGIISIKTQPEGVDVYLNGKLFSEKTPATINELIPGTYSLRLESERYYPWVSQVKVEARKVVRLEKIILFPKRTHIKQLNQEEVSSFWLDTQNSRIYYFNQEENILYVSNLDGGKFEEIGSLPESFTDFPKELKVSPDKEKVLIFSAHQIVVLNLNSRGELSYAQLPVILEYPKQQISKIFWHSDSYHLILVSDKNIEVLEADNKTHPLNLVSLNKKVSEVYYDIEHDALSFMDSQKNPDGVVYNNVYQIDLNSKSYFLKDKLKVKQNARE